MEVDQVSSTEIVRGVKLCCETSQSNVDSKEIVVNQRQRRPEELQFRARIVDTMRPDPKNRGCLTPGGMGASASA